MAAVAGAQVAVNEFMYNSFTGAGDEEYVELLNYGEQTVDLSGWRLAEGVRYTFPTGTRLEAGGYLVVAQDPARAAQFYNLDAPHGPFEGRLADGGETIRLLNADGIVVESFTYVDEEGWPQTADGGGASVERRHPRMPAAYFPSWSAGPVGGTPGRANASAIEQPKPIVWDVSHTPLIPSPTEPVSVRCRVVSTRAVDGLTLLYRDDRQPPFLGVPMEPGENGVYTASIPPGNDGKIREFYIQALSPTGASGTFPLDAPQRTALYQVDSNTYPDDLPLYSIVIREDVRRELARRNLYSDVLLDACFYTNDEAFYNVGFRYRGKGSRNQNPNSYRVDFTDVRPFGGVRKLNLNGWQPWSQLLGLEFFRQTNMVAPTYRLVSVLVNGSYVRSYLQVERTGKAMMENTFGDGSGNLYRGLERGNFDYRGENKEAYRPHYRKETNEREDDYSDLIELCAAFATSDDREFAVEIEKRIDVEQWLRWFAIKAVLNDEEGGIFLDKGDDYYTYHNPIDGRFHMLPWDMDSVVLHPRQDLFRPTVPAIRRLITHPAFVPRYYSQVASLMADEFQESRMAEAIALTEPITTPEFRQRLLETVRGRRADIQTRIPGELTVAYELVGGAEIRLSGTAPATQTSLVTVNGQSATYHIRTANWDHAIARQLGWNGILVEARDYDGQVVASATTGFFQAGRGGTVGGTLSGDTRWTVENSPYFLSGDLIVPRGATLTVEAGTEIALATGVGIIIQGQLFTEGIPGQPVTFRAGNPDATWNGLFFENPGLGSALRSCEFHDGSMASRSGERLRAFIHIEGTPLSVEGCEFTHLGNKGIEAHNTALTVRESIFNDLGEAIHCTRCSATIESCTFTKINGYSDAIDFDFDRGQPSVIRNVIVIGGEDDGIDLGTGNVLIDSCRISGMADKGISVDGDGGATVTNSILTSNDIGVAVKDGSSVRVVNCTLVDNLSFGVRVYQKIVGQGGGDADVVNSIVWRNGTQLEVDSFSTLRVSHCLVGGGFGGTEIIDGDPLFADADGGDFHLTDGSPCVDRGTSVGAPGVDIEGRARPRGGGYDLGAFESDAATRVRGWERFSP